MVGSINKVILIGNVGQDPDIRVTQHGTEIANFSLATTDSWRDKHSGERKERTEWHRIVVFSEGLVRIIKEYVKKGTKLYLEGNLQTRKWKDQSGNDRQSTEIVLQGFNSTLTILSNMSSTNDASYDNPTNNNGKNTSNNDFLDDEIPF